MSEAEKRADEAYYAALRYGLSDSEARGEWELAYDDPAYLPLARYLYPNANPE